MAKLDNYECDGQMELLPLIKEPEKQGIEQHIPFGKKNAVTRQFLCIATGMSDRKVRAEIAKDRREHPILNLSDEKGYYRPTIGEYMEAKQFYRQEQARAKSIFWSLFGLKKWLRKHGGVVK